MKILSRRLCCFIFLLVFGSFSSFIVSAQEKSPPNLGAAQGAFERGEQAAAAGDRQSAENFFRAALAAARKSGDKKAESEVLNRLGNFFKENRKVIVAREFFTLAAAVRRELGDEVGETRALVSRAAIGDQPDEANRPKTFDLEREQIFLKAVAFFEKHNAFYEKSLALNNLGGLEIARRDYAKAEKYLLEALELKRKYGAPLDEIGGLRVLGVLKNNENKPALARPFFEQALAKLEKNPNDWEQAETLAGLGQTEFISGHFVASLSFYQKALAIYERIGRTFEVSSILTSISSLHLTLGQNDLARQTAERARKIADDIGDASQQAFSANALGGVYWRTGDYPAALKTFDYAAEKSLAAENFSFLALSYFNLGSVYNILGDFPRALVNLQKSYELQQKYGGSREQRFALLGIGRTLLQQNKLPEAKAKFDQLLEFATADKDAQNQAFANQMLGTIALRQKNPTEAQARFAAALTLHSQAQSILGIALTLQGLADSFVAQKQFEQAQAIYGQTLPIFRQVNSPTGEAAVFEGLMNSSRAAEKRRLAIFYGKQSVNLVQKIRASLSILETEVQKNFIASNENVYRVLAALLIEDGRLAEAQQVIALLKEDEYFQYIRRDEPNAPNALQRVELNAEETAAAGKYQQLTDKINVLAQRQIQLETEKNALAEGAVPAPEKLAEQQKIQVELSTVNNDFAVFIAQTNANFSRPNAAPTNSMPTAVGEKWQTKLAGWNGEAALITTLVTENKVYLILTTGDARVSKQLDVSAAELNGKISAFREVLQDSRTDALPAAQELYRLLIAPLAKELQKTKPKTLLFSLDGALRYVPFAALHDGRKFLIESYATATVTLAQTAAEVASAPREWRGLGAGAAKKIGEFDALPNVADELKIVVRQNAGDTGVFNGRRLLDAKFTRRNFSEELARKYNLVHLASHFVVRPGKDADSFLLLGDGERLDLATVRTAAEFDFGAVDLLTLSACETAFASGTDGAEIESFAVLTQKRGARSVLATLWAIADESPKLLLKNFYVNYQKQNALLSKAEALRRAQIKLLADQSPAAKNFSHPFYWSSFVLLGQWK